MTPSQMHVSVRLEVIFNQLVFLHALRTRVNTASAGLDGKKRRSEKGAKAQENTAPKATAAASTESSNGATSASGSSSQGPSTAVASQASSTTLPKPKKDDTKAKDSKRDSTQAGSISNLIMVDANNLEAFLEPSPGASDWSSSDLTK
jgi:hypothetical protein